MTKAEEAARDYILTSASPFPNTETAAVIYGYMRAEKDLALTWEDIKTIVQILVDFDWYDFEINGTLWSKEFYEEMLRRFMQFKEVKK